MHIAQIAPSKCHDGTQRVIRWLAEELVALGHHVTLCGCGSISEGPAAAGPPQAAHIDDSVADAPAFLALEQVRQNQNSERYDFLHFHSNNHPFCPSSRQDLPFVTTLHGCFDLPHHHLAFDRYCHPPAVSVSAAQRRSVPQANWVQTIHCGLPQRLLMPVPAEPRYFAFSGPIGQETGVDHAISIARKCEVPIRIAGRIDKQNCEYFDEMIAPLLDGSCAEYIGELTVAEKSQFLSGAVALLDSAGSPEACGLAIVEAMACGTPVIAFNRGPALEMVDHGWTGFIVDDKRGAIEAFNQLSQLSRGKIRSRFEQRFTARRMTLEYLDVYRSLIDCDFHFYRPAVDVPEPRWCQDRPVRQTISPIKYVPSHPNRVKKTLLKSARTSTAPNLGDRFLSLRSASRHPLQSR